MSINYANRDSFNVYKEYIALKNHFTSKYDYHKYGGKTSVKFDSFQTRKDVIYFHKLSKEKYWKQMIIANLIHNPNMWVREVLESEGQEVYLNWKKRVDSLSYNFKNEIKNMDDDYKKNFVVVGGQHPLLLKSLLRGEISMETFTIVSHLANVLDVWEEKVLDKFIACDIFTTSKKYRPFLEIDEKKFKNILKERFF